MLKPVVMSYRMCFTNRQRRVIAEAEVDLSATRGAGGPGYPSLQFWLTWNFSAGDDPNADDWIIGLNAQLFNGQDHDRIADASPNSLRFARNLLSGQDNMRLEFPLDRYRVELLEQRRNGGDMELRMEVQLLLAHFGNRLQSGKPEKEAIPFALDFENPSESSIHLRIPQSVWIRNVLPGLGYGIIHVLEFPAIGLDSYKKLQHSYAALQRAQTKFTVGDYDEAIWLCRTAIDPLRNELKKIKHGNRDNLSADWAEKIGPATADWLLTVFSKTHGVANTPTHSPNTGHFSRLDAQMIMTVTAAVLAYVARTKVTPSKQ